MRRHRRSRRNASLTERARCYPLPWRHYTTGCRAGLPPRSFSLDHWWEVLSLRRRVLAAVSRGAVGHDERRRQAAEAGAFQFLTKPVNFNLLKEELRRLYRVSPIGG
jgi:hypothetical protein